jgi:hypothetical protein
MVARLVASAWKSGATNSTASDSRRVGAASRPASPTSIGSAYLPVGATAVADTSLRLTLVVLLLRPMGPWYTRAGLLLVAALGAVAPSALRAPATWLTLSLLVTVRLVADWPLADNHIYLLAYWCLAIALALRAATPAATLARSSRLLIGLAFLCAVLWKGVLSPDYLDGRFFRVTLLTDDRFSGAAMLTGLSAADLADNRAYLTPLPDGAALLDPPTLREPPALRLLGVVATWGGLVLEGAVAILFLWPSPRRTVVAVSHAAIVTFCVATYALAPVAGFGWLLLAMGQASVDPAARGWRRVYLAVFLLVLLYAEVPWSDLIASAAG